MTDPIREVVAVNGVAPPQAHYSHGIIVESGRTLYLAGQVGIDPEGNVAVGDAGAQAQTILENIQAIVEAAGGTMANVAKTSVFLTSLDYRDVVGEVRRSFFPDPPPANTLLVVESLASPDYLVEIEAIVPLP